MWRQEVTLPNTGEGLHNLRALVRTNSSVISSNEIHVTYDPSTPRVTEICMSQVNGQKSCYDPSKGIARFPFVLNPNDLQFTIKFNKPEQVSGVAVNVAGPGGGLDEATLGNDGVYRASILPNMHETMGTATVTYHPFRNNTKIFGAPEELLIDNVLAGNDTALRKFLSIQQQSFETQLRVIPELRSIPVNLTEKLSVSPTVNQKDNPIVPTSFGLAGPSMNHKYRGYVLDATLPNGASIHKDQTIIADQIYRPNSTELKAARDGGFPIYHRDMDVTHLGDQLNIRQSYFIPYTALPDSLVELVDPPTEDPDAGIKVEDHIDVHLFEKALTWIPLLGPTFEWNHQVEQLDKLRMCIQNAEPPLDGAFANILLKKLEKARDHATALAVSSTVIDLAAGKGAEHLAEKAFHGYGVKTGLKEGKNIITKFTTPEFIEKGVGVGASKGFEKLVHGSGFEIDAETEIDRLIDYFEHVVPGCEVKPKPPKPKPPGDHAPWSGNIGGPDISGPPNTNPHRDAPSNFGDPGPRSGGSSEHGWLPDPSGYVFEAVKSNRLQDVNVTLIQMDPVDHVWSPWDAAEYGQINPQNTSPEGIYGWDVPYGHYQVLYEKSQYERNVSEEIEVPPPRTDVNIGMISLIPPKVNAISAKVSRDNTTVKNNQTTITNASSIFILFDKYMMASNLTNITIGVSERKSGLEARNMSGNVAPVNATASPNGTLLARQALFSPSERLIPGNSYGVRISQLVQSYAGIQMVQDYESNVTALLKHDYNMTIGTSSVTTSATNKSGTSRTNITGVGEPVTALTSTNDPMGTNTTFTWYRNNDNEMSSQTVGAVNGTARSAPFYPTEVGVWRVAANFTDGNTVFKSKSIGFNVSSIIIPPGTELSNASENQPANATENQPANATESHEILAATNKTSVTSNSPPYANAGPDQTVDKNTNVTLRGSLSSDKDLNNKLTYDWSQTKGMSIMLKNNHTSNPSFIVPTLTKNNTQFEFLLTVTDNENASDSDTVRIMTVVRNNAPVANAGIDQVVSGRIVLLNGTASSDPDDDQLTYSWNQSAGPDSRLLNTNSPYPTLLISSIPKSDKPISLVFALTVDDGQISSKPDNVTITTIFPIGQNASTTNQTLAPPTVNQTIPRSTAFNHTSASPTTINKTSSAPTSEVSVPKAKLLPKSLQIEITTPTEGDKVSVANLQITGTSSDNDQTDCQVSVHTDNDLLPRKAIAKGVDGEEDYSNWLVLYNSSNIEMKDGSLTPITADLTCINTPINLTASYTVNIVGTEETEDSIPQKNTRSLHQR